MKCMASKLLLNVSTCHLKWDLESNNITNGKGMCNKKVLALFDYIEVEANNQSMIELTLSNGHLFSWDRTSTTPSIHTSKAKDTLQVKTTPLLCFVYILE